VNARKWGTAKLRNRRGLRVLLATTLAAGLLASQASNVGAVHGDAFNALFELGPSEVGTTENAVTNIVSNGADDPGPDWTDLFDTDGHLIDSNGDGRPNAGGEAATFVADDLAVSGSVDRTVFASSNKNGDAVDTWNWNTGNAPAKDDLSNVYAYATRSTDNDLVIFAGMERLSSNGDSHVDIEFNQDAITLDKSPPEGEVIPTCGTDGDGADPSPPCEFVGGDKKPNDFIVSIDFTNGGTLGTLEVRKWVGPATSGTYVPVGNAPTQGCNTNGGLAPDAFCGFSNGAPIAFGGWPTFNTKGNIETLATNAFAEFGINITEALGQTPCFATFSAHTRTSSSFSSELKDFAVGNFQVCRPDTRLVLDSYQVNSASAVPSGTASSPVPITVHNGDSLTLTFAESNDGNFPLDKPSGNTPARLNEFIVITNTSEAGACMLTQVFASGQIWNFGDTSTMGGAIVGNGILDPGETWKYACTVSVSTSTPTTFTAYGHGIDDATSPPTIKDVTRCASTVPPTPDPNNPALLPATVVTCDQDEVMGVTLTILNPQTTVTASVTVTFYETNDGTVALQDPGNYELVNPSGAMNNCSNFAPKLDSNSKNVGDNRPDVPGGAGNGIFDPTETWQFTCTVGDTSSGSTAASSTTKGTGHGIDPSDNSDVTFCSGTESFDLPRATTPSGGNTTPRCDQDEQRTVSVQIT
jgi:hypothetical protein